jgi:hypothetical protein
MEKPLCNLRMSAPSEFSMLYRVRDALKDAGLDSRADEFLDRAMRCGTYQDLIELAREYVAVE